MIDRLGAAVPIFQRPELADSSRSGRGNSREEGQGSLNTAAESSNGSSRANLTANPVPSISPAEKTGVQSRGQSSKQSTQPVRTEASRAEAGASGGSGSARSGELTDEQQKAVDKLKKRDAEVRAHEQAHAAVGGQFAGAPSYTETSGPDGKRYAIGGEVSIDSAPVSGDPEATIQKLQVVARAALAPAEPSAQDQAVARQAQQGLAQARAELQDRRLNGGDEGEPSSSPISQLLDLQEQADEGDPEKAQASLAATQQAIAAYQVATTL